MISALSLLRYYRLLAQRRGLPVLLILLGLVYAFMIGVMSSGPLAATYDLANWLYPILIGFHIMAHTRQYPQYRDTIVNTFIWGMLVMGGYGLIQFFIMPPWDALWMLGSQMNSQGDPVPMGVRVFSTMNSSGPFAFAMMGAMVFVMAATHRVRWIAAGARLLLVRAEPRALDVGRLGHRAADPARQIEQQGARADHCECGAARRVCACRCWRSARSPSGCRRGSTTIVNLNDDQSYAARNEFYATFAKTAFTDVSGEGMGATGTSTKLSNDGGQLGQYGNFDSGVMNIPFVLGWPGTLLYMSGIIWLVMRAVLASFKLRDDKFVSACLSLSLATFAMLVFTNSLVGTGGLLLFMSVFSILSAVHYEKMNRRTSRYILHGGTD